LVSEYVGVVRGWLCSLYGLLLFPEAGRICAGELLVAVEAYHIGKDIEKES
jgi:hypothetical protein